MRTSHQRFAAALAVMLASPVMARQGRGEGTPTSRMDSAAATLAPAMQIFRPLAHSARREFHAGELAPPGA